MTASHPTQPIHPVGREARAWSDQMLMAVIACWQLGPSDGKGTVCPIRVTAAIPPESKR